MNTIESTKQGPKNLNKGSNNTRLTAVMPKKRKDLPRRSWFQWLLIMMNSRRRWGIWSKSIMRWSRGWEQVRRTSIWLRKKLWWKMMAEAVDNRERVQALQATTTEFTQLVKKVHLRLIQRLGAVQIGTTFSTILQTVAQSLMMILKIRNKSLTFRPLGEEIVIHKIRVDLNTERVADHRPTRIVTPTINNFCKPKITTVWSTAMKFTATMSQMILNKTSKRKSYMYKPTRDREHSRRLVLVDLGQVRGESVHRMIRLGAQMMLWFLVSKLLSPQRWEKPLISISKGHPQTIRKDKTVTVKIVLRKPILKSWIMKRRSSSTNNTTTNTKTPTSILILNNSPKCH